MTSVIRRGLLCLLGLAAAFAAHACDGVVVALADGPPTLTTIWPRVSVLTGQPLRVTVGGSNLSHVISVTLVPAVSGLSFTITNDSTILLTMPASVPADTYGIFVTATGGTSDPANVPTFAVVPPVAADPGPPTLPRYSFSPMPQPRREPVSGVLGPVSPTRVAQAPSGGPLNPLLLLPLGIVLGGIGYLLWGRPGRLSAADRQGLVAHLVGRPAQALHVGRICLQCGRLHFVLATRRDLWQAGQFCSATCFVAAQEDDSAARAGESTAVARMRDMFVYSELEQRLQAALAAEALERRTGPARLDEAQLEGPAEEAELVEAAGC
ncbi:MAG TPA: hypothetical protein VGP96_05585 [Candidatus Dormibacteraeota bacterium]|nr:hypothetical protein [Candidatus Dormibacteraeota bacterium]